MILHTLATIIILLLFKLSHKNQQKNIISCLVIPHLILQNCVLQNIVALVIKKYALFHCRLIVRIYFIFIFFGLSYV